MGGRYWITGAQLGTLMAHNRSGNHVATQELLKVIFDKQFIGKRKEFEEKFSIIPK